MTGSIRSFLRAACGACALGGSLGAQAPDSLSPPHRRHHALAYDPVAQRVVLAGGQHLASETSTPWLDDAWSWDGRSWTPLASRAGLPVITHKMGADSAHGVRLVLGRGLVARLDGGRWRVIVPDSQTHRQSAATAYDPHRGRFLTFGGLVGGRAFDTSGETWMYDGTRWDRVATDGPPAMLGGAMAYDARRRVFVLFGGLDTTGRKLGDTWEWHDARWTRVASTGPSPRFGAGIAYDARRGVTVIFGGVDSTNRKLDDTWTWDGRAWQRAATGPAPSPRSEGYLAFDAARGVTVLFGGEGPVPVPTLGDTWEWDGARWRRMP